MLIPFGILSSASGGVVGDYELIESAILTDSQESVTFSNLGTYSSTYKHLQIRAVVKSAFTTQNLVNTALRINGDFGASDYSYHRLSGNGSTVSSQANYNNQERIIVGSIVASGSGTTSNQFGATVIDILDAYSTTKNTTIRSFSGATTASSRVDLNSGVRLSTAAVSSLTMFSINVANELATGSRFSLYGIRG
jgi:hypothetical protein